MKNLIRLLFGRLYIVPYSDVLSYKGSWRKGAFHGYGILEYSNGSIYEGCLAPNFSATNFGFL